MRYCAGVMVVAALLASPGGAAPVLEAAYYAPDRGTPYTWFEGARDIQTYFEQDYRAAGFIYAYFRAEGAKPLTATEFRLNGASLGELRPKTVVWWRVLPQPVPAGGIGELMIRLREPLTEPAKFEVEFDDGSALRGEVGPDPARLRIETVGFSRSRDELFAVVEALDGQAHRLTSVSLDGRELGQQARLLDPEFASGVSPIALKLSSPLERGSYHVLQVRGAAGEMAGCCVRTTDGWVPLGSYGYGTYEEYARNGCNGYNNFAGGRLGEFQAQARLQMRGVVILGGDIPESYRGHPGVFGFCLTDEPDCKDYNVKDLPHPLRIGYHAQELEARCRRWRQQDPQTPIFLTIDLTYKPANFYIYGPLADVTNPDCYPLLFGAPLTMVREVVETARYGAGPRQLTFTFQGVFHEHDDKKTLQALKFPRPPLADEERIMMLYAIGAGARGLYNYIHCTERSGKLMSRGTNEFPDVWHEIGRTYRELGHIAPVLAQAHPTRLAAGDREQVWVRTLLCGPEAVVLVVVNDDYEQQREAFVTQPQTDVRLRLPRLPWLAPQHAWLVKETGFEPVRLSAEGGSATVALPELKVAELILLAVDPKLADRLRAQYIEREQKLALGVLDNWRAGLAEKAAQRRTVRRLVGESADCLVMGRGINAYGVTEPKLWNPKNETYNVFEFGQNDRGEAPTGGAEWTLTIPPERAGAAHAIFLGHGTWGRPGAFVLRDAAQQELLKQELSGGLPGSVTRIDFTFPAAGEYTASFLLPGPGPKGGRAAHGLYVIPLDRDPPEFG